jgi:O-antigen/teichoic acid export membrane protein
MLFDAARRGLLAVLERPWKAAFWRRSRTAGRRLGWGIADQAVSSLTNFAVSIFVVRTLGAVQFGAFSLAYVTYGFALNASRGLATDPLLVRFSGTDLPTWRRAVADCTGTATVTGLATGVCALGAAALLHGTTSAAFLALGITLPGLMLQDSWRFSFFALGRGSQAFLNDMVWAGVLIPALLLLQATGHKDVFWYVLVWGAAATVAAAAGAAQARVAPRLSGIRRWVSDHRDLGPRYVAEGTSHSAAIQLRTYGFSLILGLAAVGYIAATYTLMGPMMVLFAGTSLFALPEAARVLRRSPRRMRMFCVLVSSTLAGAALGWGVILLVTVPRGLGAWLLGPVWQPAYPLVLPIAISYLGTAIGVGAGMGLHALGASRRSLRLMLIVSVVVVACALLGAIAGGVIGAARGIAVAEWTGGLLGWWQLRAALRESSNVPDADRRWPFRSPGRHRRPLGDPGRQQALPTLRPGENENA